MFKSERELVDRFNSLYDCFLTDILNEKIKKKFLLNEYDSHYGIADIVVGKINNNIKLQNNRKSVNSNWIYPLFHLNLDSIITIAEFSKIYNLSYKYASKYLNTYTEANFFTKIENNTYKKINNYEIVLDDIISIEAKLKDWQKAIKQAYRYKSFSNFSFVLLDEEFSSRALESLEIFIKYNIGLITINNNHYKIHHTPKRKNLKPSYYLLKANEVVYNLFTNSHVSY